MQVKIEDVSPVEKKLIVEVPWAAVSDKLGAAFRELGKSVALKGFRRGKVPRSVLEQVYGKRVRAEVAVQLVRESFLTATTEHSLEAVAEPHVKDSDLTISKGKPFSFEAIVEVRGDVKPENYTGMELTKRPLKVEDSAVERALEALQREHTELRPIEGREVLAESDICAFSVKGAIGEHEIDRPQITLDLGDPDHEPLPGMVKAVLGLPVNATDHALSLPIPEDYEDESVAGKTAELSISITDAREKDVPELDDEFAKDTGKAESLDELRATLRTELETRAKDEIASELRNAALAELIKRNPIPIANSLVERAVEGKLRRLQQMFGVDPGERSSLEDELKDKLNAEGVDEVRGQLLIDAVATEEKIEVEDAELDERVARIAKARNVKAGPLQAEMNRDGRLDNLRFQIRHEKTLDFLISKASVTEKEPEPDAAAAVAAED